MGDQEPFKSWALLEFFWFESYPKSSYMTTLFRFESRRPQFWLLMKGRKLIPSRTQLPCWKKDSWITVYNGSMCHFEKKCYNCFQPFFLEEVAGSEPPLRGPPKETKPPNDDRKPTTPAAVPWIQAERIHWWFSFAFTHADFVIKVDTFFVDVKLGGTYTWRFSGYKVSSKVAYTSLWWHLFGASTNHWVEGYCKWRSSKRAKAMGTKLSW